MPNVDFNSEVAGFKKRFIDMLDGTHAERVVAVNLDGTPVASAASAGPLTGTVTSVLSGVASVLILAANTLRRGAIIHNTDANALTLLLAAGAASATNLSAIVATGATYQVPFGYRGIINGIWAIDGTGAAVVTEFV